MSTRQTFTWPEWASLVVDVQKGNRRSLETLLRESKGIIRNTAVRTMNSVKPFDLEDIVQETNIRIIRNLGTLKMPRAYVAWVEQIVKRQCLDRVRRKKEASLDRLDESSIEQQGNASELNSMADLRGFTTDSLSEFEKQSASIIEADYARRIGRRTAGTDSFLESTGWSKLSQTNLGELLAMIRIHKEKELNYPDAERKLLAIINFLENKQLNTERKNSLAEFMFELGHLKMNEGYIHGPNNSTFWLSKARRIWRSLKLEQREISTTLHIGVGHFIQGEYAKAERIARSVLDHIQRKRKYRKTVRGAFGNLSNVLLHTGNIAESHDYADKSAQIAGDFGEVDVLYSQIQQAKVYLARAKCKRSYYDRAHKNITESMKNVPPYRVLDQIKANMLMIDVYMGTNQKDEAVKLVPVIREDCQNHLFHHELRRLNRRLAIYKLDA